MALLLLLLRSAVGDVSAAVGDVSATEAAIRELALLNVDARMKRQHQRGGALTTTECGGNNKAKCQNNQLWAPGRAALSREYGARSCEHW